MPSCAQPPCSAASRKRDGRQTNRKRPLGFIGRHKYAQIMKRWKTIYINSRFFYLLGVLILVLAISYSFPWLFFPARLLVGLFFALCVIEATLLFSRHTHISCERKVDGILSLGDENPITLHIRN